VTDPLCVDLFGGAGGAATGLELAGYRVRSVEYHAPAVRVSEAAGHDVVHADVRDHAAWLPGEPIDLLWASPPCQAWSSAGSRKGAADDRNGWPWTLDAIDAARPTWVLAENVPGMTHHLSRAECDGGAKPNPDACPGCYLHAVVLPEMQRRFAWVGWRVLDCADYGVPQHRRRLIIAAGPEPVCWPRPTHGHPESLPVGAGVARAWVGAGVALRGGAYVRSEQTGARSWPVGRPSPSVTGPGNLYAYADDPSARPAPTVTATEGRGCATDDRRASRAFGRRLTPAECAALQSFPPGYPLGAAGSKQEQYRAAGNAVPPPMSEALGLAVRRHLLRGAA